MQVKLPCLLVPSIAAALLFQGCGRNAGTPNPSPIGLLTVSTVTPNYDKGLIGPYTLEDPLEFLDGRKVRSAKDWKQRRQEILEIFQREMYGRMPDAPDTLILDTFDEGVTLAGYGIRRQVAMWFREDRTGPRIDWLIVTPRHASGPVPCVMMLNYFGNQTILKDAEVAVNHNWMRRDKRFEMDGHYLSGDDSRGFFVDQNKPTIYPLEMLLARGYGFVTACYADISPDPFPCHRDEKGEFAYTGVFDLWGQRDSERTDNTTSLGAWAWALRRGMDMIEKDSLLCSGRVLLTGCSRLAKAALIAGAFDERFPVVVPVQTGGGGCPIAKRIYGENISTQINTFTHWYCKAYDKYAGHEDQLTFDQHLFLSCIAPRALLIEGFDDPWYDTEAEFIAIKAAAPVWKKLGYGTIPAVDWPDDYDTSAIGEHIGYVRRSEAHGISAYDWTWMLDFADRQFKK